MLQSVPCQVGCGGIRKRPVSPEGQLASPARYKHLKTAEKVVMTQRRIRHCKATKGHTVSHGPPAVCHPCGSTLSREHILLECGTVQQLCDEFYEADSLTSLFECVPPLGIIEVNIWKRLDSFTWYYKSMKVRSETLNPISHKIQVTT